MKKIIRLTESDLTRIVKRVIEEQRPDHLMPGQSDNPTNIKNHNAKPTCVPLLFKDAVNKFVNQGYNKLFIKTALGIIGRESDFGSSNRYTFLSPLKTLLAYVGRQTSVGPSQITPETAKKYGLSVSDLTTAEGSIKGAYSIIKDNYNKAIKVGYSTNKPSINFDGGTGNSALDMAIVGFNMGQSKIVKYCKTTNPNIKKPCSMAGQTIVEQRLDHLMPEQSDNPTNLKTRNTDKKKLTVLNEWVPDYLPNYKTERWDGVNISSHGYVKEVATKLKSFNCF